MGYRDDRTAAWQRAEALAAEVARSEATVFARDQHLRRLHAQLVAARTQPPFFGIYAWVRIRYELR